MTEKCDTCDGSGFFFALAPERAPNLMPCRDCGKYKSNQEVVKHLEFLDKSHATLLERLGGLVEKFEELEKRETQVASRSLDEEKANRAGGFAEACEQCARELREAIQEKDRPCPHCRKPMPSTALVCAECAGEEEAG